MEDKFNKNLIKSLSEYINPKLKKLFKLRKKQAQARPPQQENPGENNPPISRAVPRNVLPGTDIWEPARPLHKDKTDK